MSSVLVIYSWLRLWSLGTGRGSPDFYHSLLSLTRAFERVTVLYPREKDSPFEDQVPPGVRAVGFACRRIPLLAAPGGPRLLRAPVFGVNWLLRMLNYRWFNDAAWHAAREACGDCKPDVVSAHGFMGVPAASRIAAQTGAPLLVRLFGVSLGIRGFSLPVLAAQFEETLGFKAKADRWIITDDGSGGGEAAARLGVQPEKVTMLRAAVERSFAGRVDQAGREEYRRGLGLDPRTRLVLRVCRLWAQQHLERLIDALPVTLTDGTPVATVVIGDGPERRKLEKQAVAKGKTAKFLGALPNAELGRHYAVADLYAATADRTNLGQSVLEALCHGLPVVALDTGRTSDLVRDGVNGRLTAVNDPQGLATALEQLLSDDTLRAGLAEGASRIADEEIPDLNRRLEAEAALYKQLLNEKG